MIEKKFGEILDMMEYLNKKELNEVMEYFCIPKREKDFRYTLKYDIIRYIMAIDANNYSVLLQVHAQLTKIQRKRRDKEIN